MLRLTEAQLASLLNQSRVSCFCCGKNSFTFSTLTQHTIEDMKILPSETVGDFDEDIPVVCIECNQEHNLGEANMVAFKVREAWRNGVQSAGAV